MSVVVGTFQVTTFPCTQQQPWTHFLAPSSWACSSMIMVTFSIPVMSGKETSSRLQSEYRIAHDLQSTSGFWRQSCKFHCRNSVRSRTSSSTIACNHMCHTFEEVDFLSNKSKAPPQAQVHLLSSLPARKDFIDDINQEPNQTQKT